MYVHTEVKLDSNNTSVYDGRYPPVFFILFHFEIMFVSATKWTA